MQKTVGLIGGMSWESSLEYYRGINRVIRDRKGGQHSAQILLLSVDFEKVRDFQTKGDWAGAGRFLAESAKTLESGGASFVALCTNTMHKVAPEIESALNVPFLHIGHALSQKLKKEGIKKVGLLGTMFTMEDSFYVDYLKTRGIETLTPEKDERSFVHHTIFEEFCKGKFNGDTRAKYLGIVEQLQRQGAEAVILGCTEIGILVKQEHTSVPIFDTTEVHVEAIADGLL